MNSPAPTLAHAWLERWNQRLEPALRGLAEAQTAAGWENLSVEDFSRRQELREEYLEALLLKASLLRAQGFRQKSSALLAKIQQAVHQAAERPSFHMLFELGLDHWIDQDLAQALECFLLAERRARPGPEQAFTAMNILLCLEALDLPQEEAAEKLGRLLEVPGPLNHVQEQWQAYLARRDFYREMRVGEGERSGSVGFFAQWARSLPYVGHPGALALSQDYLWQGSYRLRTLARIWIPADQSVVRVGDAIDRLYLWVWLAMAARPEITKEKIFYTLESVLHDFEFENQGKENLLLLRNALGWALLLYPALRPKVGPLWEKLAKVASPHYPVLEAELDLVHWLSGRGAAGAKPLFESFPAFAKIYREMQSSLPFLQEKLTPIQAQARNFEMIVDQSREEILLPGKGKLVPSKGLTKLFSLMIEHEEVPLDAVESFEPLNLVYRARKLLGPNTVLMKRKALSKGPAWPKTLLLSDVDLPAYQLSALKPSLVESDAHLQAARALLPGGFRRKELEKRLAVSKASANRMIENWLREGKLSSTGRAKATQYSWNEEKTCS